jgi:uncharacterized membrane protein
VERPGAAAIAFWPQYLKAWITVNHLRTIASALSAIVFAAALFSKLTLNHQPQDQMGVGQIA